MHKGRKFKQLSKEERAQIEVLLQQGFSQRAIASALGRSASTISRELSRNSKRKYQAEAAHHKAQRRHKLKPKHMVFDQQMKDFICWKLRNDKLSPELISVLGKQLRPDFVCAERIYQWVWQMKFSQAKAEWPYQDLYEYLRHACRRRKRGRKRHNRGNILERVFISHRPEEANKRAVTGHLEGDIVLGKDRKPGLLVVLDRKSRRVWMRKLEHKSSPYVCGMLKSICRKAAGVQTLTLDNDQSFAEHYRLQSIGVKTYFTDPYCSQQKGSVENRIGLIRMFFPKKTDFSTVTSAQVRKVQNLLNNRPLRIFGYKTPKQVFQE